MTQTFEAIYTDGVLKPSGDLPLRDSEPSEILASIRSKPDTPRVCRAERAILSDVRKRIEKHIKDSYLKRVDAPQGVKPSLKCWMELAGNE